MIQRNHDRICESFTRDGKNSSIEHLPVLCMHIKSLNRENRLQWIGVQFNYRLRALMHMFHIMDCCHVCTRRLCMTHRHDKQELVIPLVTSGIYTRPLSVLFYFVPHSQARSTNLYSTFGLCNIAQIIMNLN